MPENNSNQTGNRVFVLDGNPGRATFCQAIADAACEEASNSGHEVRYLRLSQMSFDPNLAESYRQDQQLEPDLISVQEALSWCNRLIIVHPLWWGSAPAKLKGLFDRVLLPDFAFKYISGKAMPEKLLTGKTAKVIITSDTPAWFLRWGYGNGWPKILRKQILEFCGFEKVKIRAVGPIRSTKDDARKKILEKNQQFLA